MIGISRKIHFGGCVWGNLSEPTCEKRRAKAFGGPGKI